MIVTLTKGICVVNGVSHFKLSNAMEHVLAIKETSAKLQECIYLSWHESTNTLQYDGIRTQ